MMYRFCNIYFSLKLDITRGIKRLSHISTEFTSKRAIEVYLILCQLCSRDSRYSEYVPRSQYTKIWHVSGILTLFRMGFFGAAQEWRGGVGEGGQIGPLLKICHTYPAMMKIGKVIPYPKKIQKIH